MRKITVSTIILVLLDQISKFIVTKFYINSSFNIIPGILGFLVEQNTNGSYLFSLMDFTAPLILQIFILILAFGTIYFLYKYLFSIMNTKIIRISLIFILAGSLSSAIDTIFWGGSWDFMYLYNWFIFDIKDLYLSLGVAIFLFKYIKFHYSLDKKERKKIGFINWLKEHIHTKFKNVE